MIRFLTKDFFFPFSFHFSLLVVTGTVLCNQTLRSQLIFELRFLLEISAF